MVGKLEVSIVSATFDEIFALPAGERVVLGQRACVLRGFACEQLEVLMPELLAIVQRAQFRQMVTPRGDSMSVAMTNCGDLGWITDRRGYRYARLDPHTGAAWPPMPSCFGKLATAAAEAAGFPCFKADACLINRYLPGARLSLHQDKDERDFDAPIVSVSLGIPATFLFGGHKRNDTRQRVPLMHGDVVVWGGEDRLRFHGVAAVKDSVHPMLGAQRINLTFRKAA
jgi:alkylated DNA repair protein (DNA oxidative demethylase)